MNILQKIKEESSKIANDHKENYGTESDLAFEIEQVLLNYAKRCEEYQKAFELEKSKVEILKKVISNMRRSQWPEGECFGEKAYLVPCSDFGKAVNAISNCLVCED